MNWISEIKNPTNVYVSGGMTCFGSFLFFLSMFGPQLLPLLVHFAIGGISLVAMIYYIRCTFLIFNDER